MEVGRTVILSPVKYIQITNTKCYMGLLVGRLLVVQTITPTLGISSVE
jgi:hypothetical protein